MVVANQEAGHVWCDKADKADNSGEADHAGGQQHGQHHRDDPHPPDLVPQRGRHLVAPLIEGVVAPCVAEQQGKRKCQQQQNDDDLLPSAFVQGAKRPMHNHGQLLFRGHKLSSVGEGTKEVGQGDARQNEGGGLRPPRN